MRNWLRRIIRLSDLRDGFPLEPRGLDLRTFGSYDCSAVGAVSASSSNFSNTDSKYSSVIKPGDYSNSSASDPFRALRAFSGISINAFS